MCGIYLWKCNGQKKQEKNEKVKRTQTRIVFIATCILLHAGFSVAMLRASKFEGGEENNGSSRA
jgi:nicotinamide riboside transporter PnuC